jgi:hypothetical protein
MKTFDYAAAWREVARPAYLALSADVLRLYAATAEATEGRHQAADLAMDWPEGLREQFALIDSEALAWAAHVIHNAGHWHPSKPGRPIDLPGRNSGAHWKFSHLADQELRGRLGMAERGRGMDAAGLSYEVHQGALRLCYSSKNSWTWAEVAPATEAGRAAAEPIRRKLAQQLAGIHTRHVNARDQVAHQGIEAIRQGGHAFPQAWAVLLDVAGRFMVEEGDQAPDPDVPPPDLAAIQAAKVERLRKDCAAKVRELERERDGRTWWTCKGFHNLDNLIYYAHTDVFTWGWRQPVGPVLLGQLLDVVSEFPYPYAIKTHDGRTLEGGQG